MSENGKSMFIVDASQSDIPAIQKLAGEVWKETYARIYDVESIDKQLAVYYSDRLLLTNIIATFEGRQYFRLIYSDDALAGLCSGALNHDLSELTRLYIRSQLHSKGLGSLLLTDYESAVQSCGCNVVCCYVHRLNQPAISFYIRRGFHYVSGADDGDDLLFKKTFDVAASHSLAGKVP